jgi:hypothetical protein
LFANPTFFSQRSRRSKEPDPDAMAIDNNNKEEVALQSGSEEGEIEEV